jgi:hypothetical protein
MNLKIQKTTWMDLCAIIIGLPMEHIFAYIAEKTSMIIDDKFNQNFLEMI